MEFTIYSGFSKENILNLRIIDVRFHDLTSTGEAEIVVKGGKREFFSLCNLAVEVVRRAVGSRKDGFVFINPRTKDRCHSINRTFDRAVSELGLTVGETKLRFHDLRHMFATWLYEKGIGLDVLRPLLGHKDRKTTDRYAYLDRKKLEESLPVMPIIRSEKEVKMARIGRIGS